VCENWLVWLICLFHVEELQCVCVNAGHVTVITTASPQPVKASGCLYLNLKVAYMTAFSRVWLLRHQPFTTVSVRAVLKHDQRGATDFYAYSITTNMFCCCPQLFVLATLPLYHSEYLCSLCCLRRCAESGRYWVLYDVLLHIEICTAAAAEPPDISFISSNIRLTAPKHTRPNKSVNRKSSNN